MQLAVCSLCMSTNDDTPERENGIKSEQDRSRGTERRPSVGPPGVVGPESEARGGPEAPSENLPEDRVNEQLPAGMPPNTNLGRRAALPPGSLPGPYLGPQSDENRQPAPGASSPTGPAETVPAPSRATPGNASQPD